MAPHRPSFTCQPQNKLSYSSKMWSSSPVIALFVSDLHLKCYLEVFFDHIFKIALSPPTFVEKYLSPYSALFFLLSTYHYRK